MAQQPTSTPAPAVITLATPIAAGAPIAKMQFLNCTLNARGRGVVNVQAFDANGASLGVRHGEFDFVDAVPAIEGAGTVVDKFSALAALVKVWR
jgi:hypothetical protein